MNNKFILSIVLALAFLVAKAFPQSGEVVFDLGGSIANRAEAYFGTNSSQYILASAWSGYVGTATLTANSSGNLAGANYAGSVSSQLLSVSEAQALATSLGLNAGAIAVTGTFTTTGTSTFAVDSEIAWSATVGADGIIQFNVTIKVSGGGVTMTKNMTVSGLVSIDYLKQLRDSSSNGSSGGSGGSSGGGGGSGGGGTVTIGDTVESVTLCVTEAYTFNGEPARAVTDIRVVAWLENMDASGVITQDKLTDVPKDVAQAVIDADPSGAFYYEL